MMQQRYTPDDQEILDWLAESQGRPLTEQEAWLSLAQARELGELPQSPTWDGRVGFTGMPCRPLRRWPTTRP